MFRHVPIRLRAPLLIAALLLLTSPPLTAQSTGRLTGTAAQAESGEALVGAEVRVLGTSLVTLTDAQGRFFLPRVPVGRQTVEIGYLGRETQTREVTVQTGAVNQLSSACRSPPSHSRGSRSSAAAP